MIYPYQCDCGRYVDAVRPASEAALPEICTCGLEMVRIWTPPMLSVPTSGYYDHGLGCWVGGKANAMSQLRAKGIDPIEVGTETKALRSIKKKEISYELPRGALDGYSD